MEDTKEDEVYKYNVRQHAEEKYAELSLGVGLQDRVDVTGAFGTQIDQSIGVDSVLSAYMKLFRCTATKKDVLDPILVASTASDVPSTVPNFVEVFQSGGRERSAEGSLLYVAQDGVRGFEVGVTEKIVVSDTLKGLPLYVLSCVFECLQRTIPEDKKMHGERLEIFSEDAWGILCFATGGNTERGW